MFSKEIEEAVSLLSELYQCRNRKRSVIAKYPIIEIYILEQKRNILFNLYYIHDQYLEIQVPTYQYLPRISHYDFKKKESRWVRNKGIIFSFVRDLKYCGLWNFVINKDFLIINENNEFFDKDKAIDNLKKVLDDDKRYE
jgi:hypothetical protein